jgi:hypothetical protein
MPSGGEPAVPWPEGDTLGIGLESYPYPHPVHYLDVTHVAQADWIDRQAPDWERRARLAYMDVPPDNPQSKGAVLLVHGKNFFGAYWTGVIAARPSAEGPSSSAGCNAPRRPLTCCSTSPQWTSSLR